MATPPDSSSTKEVPVEDPDKPEIISISSDEDEETEYVMSGALGEGDKALDLPENDATVCLNNIEDLVVNMPFRLLSAYELVAMPGLFRDPQSALKNLTREFWTTVYGLHRALGESRNAKVEDEELQDMPIIGALAIRGGHFKKTPEQPEGAQYPEFLIPFMGENDRTYDQEYWDAVFAQGKLWVEMKGNRLWPRYSGINAWL